ncbi:putative RNA polymerase I associated factor, A49 [Helianthus anomalus]
MVFPSPTSTRDGYGHINGVPVLHRFYLSIYMIIYLGRDEEVKESLTCIFSYINHLIKFKDKHSMDGYSSAKHHKLPNILNQKFNDMFANTESKRLADDKRDLLISYVLVLTLFVDNFKTEFSDIAKDLRMSLGALRPHFEYLGCKFVREHNITLATLPAPLKFPEIRMRRRR